MHFYEGRPWRDMAWSRRCHLRQSGEQIITQGETGATFYIMFSGTVDVYKESSPSLLQVLDMSG